MGRNLGPEHRRALVDLAGLRCESCGWVSPDQAYVDLHHIIPVVRGGRDWPENLVCLCPLCHRIADRLTRQRALAWARRVGLFALHPEQREPLGEQGSAFVEARRILLANVRRVYERGVEGSVRLDNQALFA